MNQDPAIDVADRLLGMTALFSLTMDRRPNRPAGEPTRLQAFLLSLINRHEGLSLTELVRRLDVSAATASQMVTHLESRGWVARAFDPTDRRRHRVDITPAGQAVVKALRERQRQTLTTILSQLTPAEQADLLRLAERLVTIVQGREDAADGPKGVSQ